MVGVFYPICSDAGTQELDSCLFFLMTQQNCISA